MIGFGYCLIKGVPNYHYQVQTLVAILPMKIRSSLTENFALKFKTLINWYTQ